jgi:MoxR-like ATPase
VFEHRWVLDEKKNELVKALVTFHIETDRTIKTDFMDGKVEGLIMLLHGGPGTGKTLTAESIAELVQRPLYRVTCGDFEIDAESVEKYLESVLFIESTWNCVVLLDEADVFLEERN